jgi:5-methylthioadenosine/S-adenosylhomocysteine deaminase
MPTLRDCVVLSGPELAPHQCARLTWSRGVITHLDLGPPAPALQTGALVVIPALSNAFTQIGDSPLVDAAAQLPASEAFGSPRAEGLAALPPPEQFPHVAGHLAYLARGGVVRHLDWCEPGGEPARMLTAAAQQTGVESILLGRLGARPFSPGVLMAGVAPLPEPARAELEAMLGEVDGFATDGLTAPACEEVVGVTTVRHKLRALACPAPGFARALAALDPHLVAPLSAATDEEIAALARAKKSTVVAPRAAAALGLPPPPLAALLRAGVPVLLGTGSAMLNVPSLFAELDFAWKLARQQSGSDAPVDPLAILRMATCNIHAVLRGHYHGHLATGLPADLVVLNFTSPHLRATRNLAAAIVSRLTPEDVLATYRAGEPIWRTPQFEP